MRTHWETSTNFLGFHLFPRFRAYLGATTALLAGFHQFKLKTVLRKVFTDSVAA